MNTSSGYQFLTGARGSGVDFILLKADKWSELRKYLKSKLMGQFVAEIYVFLIASFLAVDCVLLSFFSETHFRVCESFPAGVED